MTHEAIDVFCHVLPPGYCQAVRSAMDRPSAMFERAQQIRVMVDLDARQQMLFWDERETPGYGINIAPKENHLKFIRCWKDVNSLALKAIPKESQPYGKRFERTPDSWRVKRPIQSE